ncbi:MAG TPA: hydrogen peroxide-dependent heme synthase [Actinomycetota bacterium]|nr:hydrogen peroxide-dependent heme synthase [Actinomycetota bacterium]
MAEEQVTYAYYPVFRRRQQLTAKETAQGTGEWNSILEEFGHRVTARGFYLCTGFRPDADLMLWLVAGSPDELQEVVVHLRRTALGRALELTHSFLGAVRPAEFNPQHQPAFLRGEEPRKYLSVYPFVRTPEWYLLPAEDRSSLLKEHGELARDYPDVLPNTTSSFGLGDWEWILAFEADELHRIVDLIRKLREAEARRYTKEEVPFVIGIRKPLEEALSDLA